MTLPPAPKNYKPFLIQEEQLKREKTKAELRKEGGVIYFQLKIIYKFKIYYLLN